MNGLLLDTHTLLWALGDADRLSDRARARLHDASVPAYCSAASTWEIAIKRSRGKLDAPSSLIEEIEAAGFAELPVRWQHTLAAGELPHHHTDPFDRLIVAQALSERLAVVTRDENIRAYGVEVLW